jgi:hypothetical protein
MPAGPHVSQAIQKVSIRAGTSDFVRQGYNGPYRAVSTVSSIAPNMHELQIYHKISTPLPITTFNAMHVKAISNQRKNIIPSNPRKKRSARQ